MFKLLFIILTAFLFSSCGKQEEQSKLPQDNQPHKDQNNNDQDNNGLPLQWAPDSYWLADNDWHFSLIRKDNAILLVKNEAIAQIINNHLLWIFDNGGHEGYSQNYRVTCNNDNCELSLSRFMYEWDPDLECDFQTLQLTKVDGSFSFPNISVQTIMSDYPNGTYYTGNPADYSPYHTNNLTQGLIIDATLVVSTSTWDQGFSFIEKINEEEYLVYATNTNDTPFPSSASQRNWFTLFKLVKGGTQNCATCKCTEYHWYISDNWANYRDLAKYEPTYNNYDGLVYYVEPGSCALPTNLPFDKITVQDPKHGNWDWLVTGSTVTPYDDRQLNYVEVLNSDNNSWLVAYTYGYIYNWDTSDPDRFSFERFYQLAKFTPTANDCYNIQISDLTANGSYGLDFSLDLTMSFTACNPVIIEKPDPKPENPGSNTDEPGDNTDTPTTPEFTAPTAFESHRNIDGANWTLSLANGTLSGDFNNQKVALKVLAIEDGPQTSTSHVHYYLVQAQNGHQWGEISAGTITALKLYFYETEVPYFHLFYNSPLPVLSTDTTSLDTLSYPKKLSSFQITKSN